MDDLTSYLSAAGASLSAFDYEIRSTQHQVSKTRVWGVVNSISDPPTQLASSRSIDELSYVRRILDAMFETYNTPRREVMGITSIQALGREVTKVGGAGLTQEQAERTLAGLVAEGWFERSAEGWYTLAPRALMELRGWLVETYNEFDEERGWQRIKFCEACKEIVTVGQRCRQRECNVRLHDICQAAFWASRPRKKCPTCETPWDGKAFVGQRAVTTTEEYLRGKRRSGSGRQSVPAAEEIEDDSDVEAEGEDEEVAAAQETDDEE